MSVMDALQLKVYWKRRLFKRLYLWVDWMGCIGKGRIAKDLGLYAGTIVLCKGWHILLLNGFTCRISSLDPQFTETIH